MIRYQRTLLNCNYLVEGFWFFTVDFFLLDWLSRCQCNCIIVVCVCTAWNYSDSEDLAVSITVYVIFDFVYKDNEEGKINFLINIHIHIVNSLAIYRDALFSFVNTLPGIWHSFSFQHYGSQSFVPTSKTSLSSLSW